MVLDRVSFNYKRFTRYVISGGSAAVAEYGTFLVFERLGLTLLLANSFSFSIGLLISFALNRNWVFEAKHKKVTHQFLPYLGLAIVNLFISDLLIHIFSVNLGITSFIAKLMAMACVAAWNYLFFFKFIFRNDTTPAS